MRRLRASTTFTETPNIYTQRTREQTEILNNNKNCTCWRWRQHKEANVEHYAVFAAQNPCTNVDDDGDIFAWVVHALRASDGSGGPFPGAPVKETVKPVSSGAKKAMQEPMKWKMASPIYGRTCSVCPSRLNVSGTGSVMIFFFASACVFFCCGDVAEKWRRVCYCVGVCFRRWFVTSMLRQQRIVWHVRNALDSNVSL